MFRLSWLPDLFARAFQAIPDEPIWEWACREVWLENKEAAEPGPYRIQKTPWNKRLQEVARDPWMWCWSHADNRWLLCRVSEYNVMKSSQAGVSEACLNVIRWRARYRPCNTIYAIDTREEAKEISSRLLPSLRKLDPTGKLIFTGDDDDLGTMVLRLLAMNVWFFGSFSSGKFANKQAPLVIVDEKEEHAQIKGDTSSGRNLKSRSKTSKDGLQINLSKPKLRAGPIHKDFERGNQERYFIRCPHCGHRQWLSFFAEEVEVPFEGFDDEHLQEVVDEETGRTALLPRPLPIGQVRKIQTGRIVFEHCKDALNQWDKLQVLRDSYYECARCKGRIDDADKPQLLASAMWLPTAHGSPGVISQQVSDLYSLEESSTFGHLAQEFIDALKEGRRELQGFYNHRLGLAFSDIASKTTVSTIRSNIAGQTPDDACDPYPRGLIPFVPKWILLGSDIGGNYAKWAVGAVAPNLVDIAIFDWGTELDPSDIATLMQQHRWECRGYDKPLPISLGFMDIKFRKKEALAACLAVPGRRLIPTTGLGGTAARAGRVFAYVQIPTFRKGFKELQYNDRDAKDELYEECLKKKKRRVWFPIDVENDPEFVAELCAEEKKPDANGVMKWDEHPGANHYGDCVKDIVNGLRFYTRELSRQAGEKEGGE